MILLILEAPLILSEFPRKKNMFYKHVHRKVPCFLENTPHTTVEVWDKGHCMMVMMMINRLASQKSGNFVNLNDNNNTITRGEGEKDR